LHWAEEALRENSGIPALRMQLKSLQSPPSRRSRGNGRHVEGSTPEVAAIVIERPRKPACRIGEGLHCGAVYRPADDDGSRRTSPVAGRPAEGLLTQPTAVARPGARELVFMSSRPEGSHLRALPDPYVNLSIHTAPDVRPFPWQSCQCAKSVGFTRRSRSNQSRAPLVLRRNRLNLRRAQRMT
jgi:hypothetical protein